MDVNEIMEYLITPVAQIALIIGLAELAKKTGCPARWIPIVDVVLGLISGICVYSFSLGYEITNGIILGIAMGLSACGLFSGIKNVAAGGEDDDLN